MIITIYKKSKGSSKGIYVKYDGALYDENYKIIVDNEVKMNTWRNYIEHLYKDTSKSEMVPDIGQMDNLPIMTEEVKKATFLT